MADYLWGVGAALLLALVLVVWAAAGFVPAAVLAIVVLVAYIAVIVSRRT
jgi:hypothetical protein